MARWGSGSPGVSRMEATGLRDHRGAKREKQRGGDKPCSWGMYCTQESEKPSLSAYLPGGFWKHPCLSFPVAMESVTTPWLPPPPGTQGRGRRLVCGGGSRVVCSQDNGLQSSLLCHDQGPVPVPLSTSNKNEFPGDFPSDPAAKTLCSQGRGPGLIPGELGWETRIPRAAQHSLKIKLKFKNEVLDLGFR